jgi:flagellar biosynthetic protein FliQ
MTPEFTVDLLKNLMYQAVVLAAPVLLVALAIGLAVSLFQAVTSIQEQTLAFVPKALGVLGLLVLLLPWMLRTLIDFTTVVIERIPDMVK